MALPGVPPTARESLPGLLSWGAGCLSPLRSSRAETASRGTFGLLLWRKGGDGDRTVVPTGWARAIFLGTGGVLWALLTPLSPGRAAFEPPALTRAPTEADQPLSQQVLSIVSWRRGKLPLFGFWRAHSSPRLAGRRGWLAAKRRNGTRFDAGSVGG